MKIGLKWVHMARYGLILRLERALWLTIIFKPLLTPKRGYKNQKNQKKTFFLALAAIHPGWGYWYLVTTMIEQLLQV